MTSSTRKQSRRQCGHRRHRQSYQGYRTCYYRTFNVGRATPAQHDAYKTCREWLDNAIDLIKPGVSTDRVAAVWPAATDFGFPDEMSAFGLQFGHGLGLALHARPIFRAWSRSIGQWRSRQAWCSRARHTVLPRTDIPRSA
jgi:Xaa-Pro aminopeptidase